MITSLYIHIPFCIKKCVYCDFYSIPFSLENAGAYTEALCREIALREGMAKDLRTIYIGGGTPTLLPEDEMVVVLEKVEAVFSVYPDAEITIEANPGTVSEKKLLHLRSAGINRISIGVQSLDDRELKLLGRCHTSQHAVDAVRAARKAGFDTISLDLIYGIPGQTLAAWKRTLTHALSCAPEHLSTYELTPERETPLWEHIRRHETVLPSDDEIAEMYYEGLELLKRHGYLHYEISNLALPGRACKHNMNYWKRGDYLGIGAAAHSFFEGKRIANISNAERYIEELNRSSIPVGEETLLSVEDALKEHIFLGLRMTEGLDLRLLNGAARIRDSKAVGELIRHGLLELNGQYLRLTLQGLVLSSEVMVRLLEGL
ncbi:MAG: radical SAM family heme chaperone HemW [Nitrospirota bacterium]